MLDLGNLIHVFQRHLAHRLMAGSHGTTKPTLARLHVGSLEQQPGGRGSAEVEGEGAIGADGNTGGYGDAGVDVGGSGVEFLFIGFFQEWLVLVILWIDEKRDIYTLQKSMLFTPLLPRAGPTGGLGLA